MWTEVGEQVIVGINVNDCVGNPDIITFFGKFGMAEAITNQHSLDAPLTHQLGSQAINGLFINPGLLGCRCGYLGGLDSVTGDHWVLWLDLPEQSLFRGSMPPIIRAGTHHLKSDDPRMCSSYLKHLINFFEEYLILQKAQQIEHKLESHNLLTQHEEELKRLDNLCIQGMLQAKHKCRKLHTQPYGWTLELTWMMTELQYWWAALHQAEGKPYNTRFLQHLT